MNSTAILKPGSNALSTGIRIFLKTEIASARNRRFQAPKTQVFENGLQSGVFENAGLPLSFGRTKTEVFEYDDFIHHTAHGL